MIKVDVLIEGNLVANNIVGGGKIYPCRKEKLYEYFDVEDAVRIDGSVTVDSFDSKQYTVVVTGAVAAQGGGYGE